MGAISIRFVPSEWRKLSDAQQRLLEHCIRNGPQIVTKKTWRTVFVLARDGFVEHVKEPCSSYGVTHPFREGHVFRASGKAWELYRAYQRGQGFGDTFIDAMRSRPSKKGA